MDRSNMIFKGKTLKELLSELDDAPSHCNSFIEDNKFGMVEIGAMDDSDYEIFWDCMKVYEACGINYFTTYIDLRKGLYGDFDQGIEAWFNCRTPFGCRPDAEQILKITEILRFFGIPSYCGIAYSEFEKACQEAYGLYRAANDNEIERRREKREETVAKQIEDYFNFGDYSERKFEELFRGLIHRQEKSISINEALALARNAAQSTYIAILKKDNRVCHIGKTENPLPYIEVYRKKFNIDSAYFEPIDADYIDDLIVGMKVLHDVELDKIHLSTLNRKYTTIKQAAFVYKRAESIQKKRIMAAIRNQKLRTVTLENGQVLIDKRALHRALYPSKNVYGVQCNE